MLKLLLLLNLLTPAPAALHHLFTGPLAATTAPAIWSLEFDDVSLALTITNTTPATAPHSHLSFNHDKKTLYGTSVLGAQSFASYDIFNTSSLHLSATVPAPPACNGAGTGTVFLLPHPSPPYAVYGQSWPSSCGAVLSTVSTGALDAVVQSYTYAPESGMHGAALAPDADVMYSADLRGNSVWAHALDATTGAVVLPELWRAAAPELDMGPRHVAVHPSGTGYAMMETASAVGVFAPNGRWGGVWSVLPDGADAADFAGNTVALAEGGRFLWASTRGQAGSGKPGYVAVFELDKDGGVVRRVALAPTATVESRGNGISPATWVGGERWAAYADFGKGGVEVWRLLDAEEEGGDMGLEVVARVEIGGGCCSSAVWYD